MTPAPATTPVHRIFNFSAGPAVMPLSVLRGDPAGSRVAARRRHVGARDQPPLEDVRRAPRHGRGRRARPCGHSGQLQGALSPGRCEHAVLDGADEPSRLGHDGRLHRHRVLGRQGDQGSEESRRGQHRGHLEGRQLLPYSRSTGALVHPWCGVRAHHLEQHDRGHGVSCAARCRRPSARQRHIVGHVQPPDRHRTAWAHLRGRAEEHRLRGCDARHHPRGPRRAFRQGQGVAADDAELCRARGERLAL